MTTADTGALVTADRIAAYRRAAVEVARETCTAAGDFLGTAAAVFYAVEAEHRLTGCAPDEIAFGEPISAEAMDEIVRLGLRTHVMRGWLHINWGIIVRRAEQLLNLADMEAQP